MPELHLVIHGKVQGVGFRFSILQEARKFGLTGFVRNLPDGTVEVVAQGPKPALDHFLSWIRSGPSGASVDRVDESWHQITIQYSDFSIV